MIASGWPGFGGILEELVFLPGGVREVHRNGEASCGREKRDACRSALGGGSVPWRRFPGGPGGARRRGSRNFCCGWEGVCDLVELRHFQGLQPGPGLPWTLLTRHALAGLTSFPAIWQKFMETVFTLSSAFHFPDRQRAREHEE